MNVLKVKDLEKMSWKEFLEYVMSLYDKDPPSLVLYVYDDKKLFEKEKNKVED